jgi:hypothetical protein
MIETQHFLQNKKRIPGPDGRWSDIVAAMAQELRGRNFSHGSASKRGSFRTARIQTQSDIAVNKSPAHRNFMR